MKSHFFCDNKNIVFYIFRNWGIVSRLKSIQKTWHSRPYYQTILVSIPQNCVGKFMGVLEKNILKKKGIFYKIKMSLLIPCG